MPAMTIESLTDDAKSLRTHVVRGDINLTDLTVFLSGLYIAKDFYPRLPCLMGFSRSQFQESHST